jgi:hypothetical protein
MDDERTSIDRGIHHGVGRTTVEAVSGGIEPDEETC